MTDGHLRDAGDLILPAVAETLAALNPPASDAALVRLVEVTARTIDAMQPGQRGMMLGQTAPLLLKLLQELEDRSRRRREKSGGRSSQVAKLRVAHGAAEVKRKGRAG